jgi:hypothetical protein
MSCDNSQPIRVKSVVEIDHPHEPNPYLAEVTLNNDCSIDPNGTVGLPYALVKRVRGRVDSGAWTEWTSYDPPMPRWSLSGVGPATAGQANQLVIELEYERDGQTSTADGSRMFRAVAPAGGGCGGDPYPYPYPYPPGSGSPAGNDSLSEALASPRQLIRETLPRYLAIRLATTGIRGTSHVGGLMMATVVHLVYDPRLSSPWEAVWLSIKLPESFGAWTLRMESRAIGPMAILTYSNLGEGAVLAPAVYQAIPWNWRSSTVFMPRPDCFTELIASEYRHLGIRVEPA